MNISPVLTYVSKVPISISSIWSSNMIEQNKNITIWLNLLLSFPCTQVHLAIIWASWSQNTMKGEQEKYIIKIWNVTTWKYILEISYVGDASDLIFYQMIRVCDTFQVGAKVELWDKIMSYQSKSFEAKPLMTSSDEINLYI